MFCMSDKECDNQTSDSTAKKIENYIFKYQDILGSGNFGSAYSGYDVNTGHQVAIKVVKMNSIKSKVSEKLLENEIEIMKNLKQHPNILHCLDVFTSVNNCYIITELCDRDLQKDLTQKGKFREHEIKEIAYGIFRGLEQLGRNSIIHRDIKISNIFMTKAGIPKIADFGFAVKSSKTFKDINIGSPLFMSPEGLLHNRYGPKTDVWSFGVLLYELLHGETPLERCRNDQQLKHQILQPVQIKVPVSFELKQLIESCLTIDEEKRPSVFDLAHFGYIRRLSLECEKNFSLKGSSHQPSTECGSELQIKNLRDIFYRVELSYENAVSLLHFCRLLHKVNKKCLESSVLSQFLLNISQWLCSATIDPKSCLQEQLSKLKQVLKEYYSKFKLEHEDGKAVVLPRELLHEVQRKLQIPSNKANKYICILDSEVKLLVYSLENQNPNVFTKNSESKSFLQASSNKPTQGAKQQPKKLIF